MTLLTQDKLKSLLSYDPNTGIFTWLIDRGGKARVGAQAGSLTKKGYLNISIHKKLYRAHRLAWLYVYGSWPAQEIDHINRNKSDNRIDNLRDASRRLNNINKNLPRNNTSGIKGVGWHEKKQKWRARIFVFRKQINLGWYSTKESAVTARMRAEERYGYAAANI